MMWYYKVYKCKYHKDINLLHPFFNTESFRYLKSRLFHDVIWDALPNTQSKPPLSILQAPGASERRLFTLARKIRTTSKCDTLQVEVWNFSTMSLFPLSSLVTIILSITELVTGALKLMFRRYELYFLLVIQFICGTAVSVSIALQLPALSYTLSKLLFSLTIILHYSAFLLDTLISIDRVQHYEKKEEEDRVRRRWYTTVNPGIVDCIGFGAPTIMFFVCPSIVLTVVVIVKRTQFHIFRPGNTFLTVFDVLDNGYIQPSFYLCIIGLGLLLIALIGITIIGMHDREFENWGIDLLLISVTLPSIVIGLSLIPSSALSASYMTFTSYLLMTIKTLPPLFSLLETVAKHFSVTNCWKPSWIIRQLDDGVKYLNLLSSNSGSSGLRKVSLTYKTLYSISRGPGEILDCTMCN